MAVQSAALLVSVGFIGIGALGFVPGVTARLETLHWAGLHSGAMLFGTFAISTLHNALHLVYGLAGIPALRSYAASRAYLVIGGLIYLSLWGYGLSVDQGSAANVMPVNDADNWLHFGLGVSLLLLAVTLAGQHDPTKRRVRKAA